MTPAVLALARQQDAAPDDLATDPDAPEGSFEWHRHQVGEALRKHRGEKGSGRRFVLEKASDLVGATLGALSWIVFGLIPEGAIIALSGEPKTSKTWLAVSLALAASSGSPLFGEFRTGAARRVLYVALEDSRRSLRTRLIALARGMALEPADAARNLQLVTQTSLNLLSDADLVDMVANCRAAGGLDLLFVDPFRDAHPAQENDSGEMQEVMKRLRFVRDHLGCSIVFIHHTAKQNAETANRRAGQRMRGSTSIHGAVDGGIYMQLTKASPCEWINTVEVELKAARGAGIFGLTLQVVDDENGEAVHAAWTFSRETSSRGQAELGELADRVVGILREHHEKNAPGQRGMNREALRLALGGVRTAKVSAAIAEAARRGQVAFVRKEGGTVFVPASEGAPS